MGNWRWSTDLLEQLPHQPAGGLASRPVEGAYAVTLAPTPVSSPQLRLWTPEVAALLEKSPAAPADALIPLLAGNVVPPGAAPFAAAYGGHQFGQWAGQLGDGRAISLGQVDGPQGRQEVQLKGAGRTPFSRQADGRAVLRSSLREFIASEAMVGLGVPTTRALALLTTGDPVVRDRFYSGDPAPEPGAIVCRVAPSFVRFGSFELPAARGDLKLLGQLVDYTVGRFFPERSAGAVADKAVALFEAVCARTEALLVHWMRVGFVHAVLNTDNMSILGLTIDYGPFGWLDPFDANWTPNTTDAATRRYRYAAQPDIAVYNLSQLARSLLPLVGDVGPFQKRLDACTPNLHVGMHRMWLSKLGLTASQGGEQDDRLVEGLFNWLHRHPTDMTLLFRLLATLPEAAASSSLEIEAGLKHISPASYGAQPGASADQEDIADWLRLYAQRLAQEKIPGAVRQAAMHAVNPAIVPRNYLLQKCIEAAEQGDFAPSHRLIAALQSPYEAREADADLRSRRPEWALQSPACSTLSCSS
jgi:uncharacterized protein YdiU (UPF0061 family)